jgi:hypothetical protein
MHCTPRRVRSHADARSRLRIVSFASNARVACVVICSEGGLWTVSLVGIDCLGSTGGSPGGSTVGGRAWVDSACRVCWVRCFVYYRYTAAAL